MAPTIPSPSSSDLLPHIVDVFDRMDLRKLSEPADDQDLFRQQLTQAVTGACQEQGLAINEQAIAEAVDAHVAEGALTSQGRAARTQLIASLADNRKKQPFGWDRPVDTAARDKKLRRLNRFPASLAFWLSQRSSILAVATGLSLATGVVVGLTADALTDFALPGQIVLITQLVVAVGTFIWLLNACNKVSTERENLGTVLPPDETLNSWLAVPETRTYLQQCLGSALPLLLKGDSHQLGHLKVVAETARLEASENQQALQAQTLAEQKMVQLRGRVLGTLNTTAPH
jgi:hypothetical protein